MLTWVIERGISKSMGWQEAYQRRFYDRSKGWQDGTTEFHALCAALASGRVLEVGAGPSNETSRFLASVARVVGLDPDPSVFENDALTEARLLEDRRFPFEDRSFDACVSNYVLEHVDDPEDHLSEVRRVLKPGAPYIFRTPNRFHYVTLVSAYTPHWFHRLVVKRLQQSPAERHDPYPTRYRINTPRAIARWARAAGLEVDRLRMVEKDPQYGFSSRVLFLGFMAYERVVNSTEILRRFRGNIFGVLRRPV